MNRGRAVGRSLAGTEVNSPKVFGGTGYESLDLTFYVRTGQDSTCQTPTRHLVVGWCESQSVSGVSGAIPCKLGDTPDVDVVRDENQ